MSRWLRYPFIAVAVIFAGLSMFVPAVISLVSDDHLTSRAFFYHGLLTMVLGVMLALSTANLRFGSTVRTRLLGFCLLLVGLPALFAVPVHWSIPAVSYADAYIDMVSCLTTTGAAFFDSNMFSEPVAFWRGMVAWMGGFIMWMAALSVLEPLGVGGFETLSSPGHFVRATKISGESESGGKLLKHLVHLLPLYCSLTLTLWGLLVLTGELPLNAFVYAMSTISTSGISMDGHLLSSAAGIMGEVFVFIFLFVALSRILVTTRKGLHRPGLYLGDLELRVAVAIVFAAAFAFFLFHWAEIETSDESSWFIESLRFFWGALFTMASFLSTSGFESAHWVRTMEGTGPTFTGLTLIGLALTGGGIATTAGGLKLLRVITIWRHGTTELAKLVYPSAVGYPGIQRAPGTGITVAWISVVLFAATTAVLMLALSASGMALEPALAVSVSVLTSTGPLAGAVIPGGFEHWRLDGYSKSLLAVAMIVGKLEVLAVIALLNPAMWRA